MQTTLNIVQELQASHPEAIVATQVTTDAIPTLWIALCSI